MKSLGGQICKNVISIIHWQVVITISKININENGLQGCKRDVIRWGMTHYSTLCSIMLQRKDLGWEITPHQPIWT